MENNSCIIYNDFLHTDINSEIFGHAINISEKFTHAKVGGGGEQQAKIDEHWNKSNVAQLDYFPAIYEILKTKIEDIFTEVCEKLSVPIFEWQRVEMRMTSHNHGEFYKPHIDRGKGKSQSRQITFVYYFHSVPKMFTGGQLLFLDNKPKPLIVEPTNNSIVFFDSSLPHAVHPVSCLDGLFEHSRFTLNGWIHRKIEDGVAE